MGRGTCSLGTGGGGKSCCSSATSSRVLSPSGRGNGRIEVGMDFSILLALSATRRSQRRRGAAARRGGGPERAV
jgi:hypothetical protein